MKKTIYATKEDVLLLIAKGYTYKKIAQELQVSLTTVYRLLKTGGCQVGMARILINIEQKRKEEQNLKNKYETRDHMDKMQPIIDDIRRRNINEERPYKIVGGILCKLDKKTQKYKPYNFMEGVDCKAIGRQNRKL